MEGEILPAPEGVLRIFSRRRPRSAFVLHGRNICSSGGEAADPTLRAAPQPALRCCPHLSVGSLPAPYPAWCRWGGGWLREGLMA